MIRERDLHYTDRQHRDSAVKSIKKWSPANRGFYDHFRRWLREGGYSASALNIYGCAARLALGWLDKPYWEIEPRADLDRVREYIRTHYASESTRHGYLKGLAKLAEFLRERQHRPRPSNVIRWETYVGPLPAWLTDDIRAYIVHRRRAWLPEVQYRRTGDTLSHLTLFLRWIAPQTPLSGIADLTPALWEDYVDCRLANGLSPVTVNGELRELLAFLHYLNDLGRPVQRRMLKLAPLKEATRLPRDLPVGDLRRLRQQIVGQAEAEPSSQQREAVMDRAWFLLMLYCGLRTGEVRRLRLDDLDLADRRVRIEQSKGLKDHVVWIGDEAFDALRAYLDVREQKSRPDWVSVADQVSVNCSPVPCDTSRLTFVGAVSSLMTKKDLSGVENPTDLKMLGFVPQPNCVDCGG